MSIALSELFSPPGDPSLLVYGVYDPWLVTLSVLVAIFSSGMGLQMAGLAAAANATTLRTTALLTGSLALGSGVWAMHFVAMLAFDLCTRVVYDPTITIFSMVPSIAASFVALRLIGQQRIGAWQLIGGGVLVGAGIGAMHYTGMAAMSTQLAQRYDPLMFGLSIVVAVTLATLALGIRFGLHKYSSRIDESRRLLIAAVVMGCAIAGMHYTGMAAARFVGHLPAGSVGSTNATFLALAVSLTTVALTVLVLAVNAFLRYREIFQQLSQSESWMRTLLATAVDGVITVDADGEIREFNAAAEAIFGWTRSEILGRSVTLLIADHEQSGEDGLLALFRSGGSKIVSAGGDVQGLRKDGALIPIRRAFGHARLAGKDLYVCFITDISDRRQREEDLRAAKEHAERAAAARAAFLANMSHEIRTPMNSILGFTDILLHDELKPEQRRHLNTVRSAGRSLLRLLNEVLDIAKLDRGAMELDMTDFDLVALIDELLSTFGADARRKNLKLEIRCDSDAPRHVHGDELRIRQVLTNLIGNAVKFTESGGVMLCVSVRQEQLRFVVSDSGIGIAADRLGSIFDAFTQADPSMNRRFGGTGLGTTISKQLVELMGGRIWAESVLGKGSAFYVELPLVVAQQPRLEPENVQSMPVLPPLRILVTDDVPQNLELLSLLLGKRGHSVVTSSSGALAVKLAFEACFDVILMDIQMPDMDGLEATRQIRAAAASTNAPRVPIIAMTASVLDADRESAHDADMDGFAAKPVDLVALLCEIGRVLRLALDGPGELQHAGSSTVLDSTQGLRRWSDQQDAYHRALLAFASNYGDCANDLARLIAADDLAATRALAHKIRGLAANLGLMQLAAELGLLEHAIAGDETATVAAMLADIQAHAVRALGAIKAQTAPSGVGAGGAIPTPLDVGSLERLSATLMQSFQRGAIDDAALKQMTNALAHHPDSARIADLWKAVDNFDFDVAQTALAALVADITRKPSTSQ